MSSVVKNNEFSDYATKEDLHQLEREIINKIDSKFDSFRSEIRGEMNSFRHELREDMKTLSDKTDASIKDLSEKMDASIRALSNKMFTGVSLAIGFVSFVVLIVRLIH